MSGGGQREDRCQYLGVVLLLILVERVVVQVDGEAANNGGGDEIYSSGRHDIPEE